MAWSRRRRFLAPLVHKPKASDNYPDAGGRNNLLPISPEYTTGDWLGALDDFRNWLIREAA
jgi:hypothetical protein